MQDRQPPKIKIGKKTEFKMDPIKQTDANLFDLLFEKAYRFYPEAIGKIREKIENQNESLTPIDYAYILNNTSDDFIHSFLKKHNVQEDNADFYLQILTSITQLREYEKMQADIQEEINRSRNFLFNFIFMHQTNLVKMLRALFKESPHCLSIYKALFTKEPHNFPRVFEFEDLIWLRPDPEQFATMVDTPTKPRRTTKIKKRKIPLSFGAKKIEDTERKETNEPIAPEPKRRKEHF